MRNEITKRLDKLKQEAKMVECPPFPREVLIEVANICNHACTFCAYRLMTRPKAIMDFQLYSRLIKDCINSGAEDIGLYAGSEPFTVRNLSKYVEEAKSVGYRYVYITSNGSLATPHRFEEVASAGLDSIKFSINAGDRDSYLKVHGKDDFNKVIKHLDSALRLRQVMKLNIKIYISFVETNANAHTYELLNQMYGDQVDAIYHVKAANVSGQNPDLPPMQFDGPCTLPFNRISISREGYLRLCCNDYQNFLVVEDLRHQNVADAWSGKKMASIRRRHLTRNLNGTLCHNCMTGMNVKALPLNAALCPYEQISSIPIVEL